MLADRTPVRGRPVATTLETVRVTRPDRVDFWLTRGLVPPVVEQFWPTVRVTFAAVQAEAERRSKTGRR